MTLLVAWAALDSKKKGPEVSSIYFATDSRYSWLDGKHNDYCQKTFYSKKYPELFAFCGDVNFPKRAIKDVIGEIDSTVYFNNMLTFENKMKFVENSLKKSRSKYEKELVEKFTILYGTRVSYYDFHVARFCGFQDNKKIISEEISLSTKSNSHIIYKDGSGKEDFENKWLELYGTQKSNSVRTSRAVYQCITDVLNITKAPTVGPIPQMIGLYRKGEGKKFGLYRNNHFFINGADVTDQISMRKEGKIEWRNDNFERVNPTTGAILPNAQHQPK